LEFLVPVAFPVDNDIQMRMSNCSFKKPRDNS